MYKPKLSKETGLKLKNKKKWWKLDTSKGVPKVWFWLFPPVKSITVNNYVISDRKLKGLGSEKVPIK